MEELQFLGMCLGFPGQWFHAWSPKGRGVINFLLGLFQAFDQLEGSLPFREPGSSRSLSVRSAATLGLLVLQFRLQCEHQPEGEEMSSGHQLVRIGAAKRWAPCGRCGRVVGGVGIWRVL